MKNTEEIQRLLTRIKKEEDSLIERLSQKGVFRKEKEEIESMKKRVERLLRWLETYESTMQEVHRRILLAAEEEMVLYPPTVFGKSHFESLLEYQDLLLIRGKEVTHQ